MNKLFLLTVLFVTATGCRSTGVQGPDSSPSNNSAINTVDSVSMNAVANRVIGVASSSSVISGVIAGQPNCSKILTDCQASWGANAGVCLQVIMGASLSSVWRGAAPAMPTETAAVISACQAEEAAARQAANNAFIAPCVNNACAAILSA